VIERGSTPVNLASSLTVTAAGDADAIAVRVGETATTYRQLDRMSAQIAGLLREPSSPSFTTECSARAASSSR
jgi:non-ribosomal peptide synthetase component E (peptide arylation enzyme)